VAVGVQLLVLDAAAVRRLLPRVSAWLGCLQSTNTHAHNKQLNARTLQLLGLHRAAQAVQAAMAVTQRWSQTQWLQLDHCKLQGTEAQACTHRAGGWLGRRTAGQLMGLAQGSTAMAQHPVPSCRHHHVRGLPQTGPFRL
jgi:hypothetical protein